MQREPESSWSQYTSTITSRGFSESDPWIPRNLAPNGICEVQWNLSKTVIKRFGGKDISSSACLEMFKKTSSSVVRLSWMFGIPNSSLSWSSSKNFFFRLPKLYGKFHLYVFGLKKIEDFRFEAKKMPKIRFLPMDTEHLPDNLELGDWDQERKQRHVT